MLDCRRIELAGGGYFSKKWRGGNKIAKTLKGVEELKIPPDGVKRKLDGVVDSVPPDISWRADS